MEDQEVPKTAEERIEILERRVGEIIEYVRNSDTKLSEQVTEIDSDYQNLRKVVHDVGEDFERRISEAASLHAEVGRFVSEFRVLAESLEDQIARAQELVQTLDKLLNSPRRVVVTRPAQPHELRDAATVPVRQASHAEIREATLAEMES